MNLARHNLCAPPDALVKRGELDAPPAGPLLPAPVCRLLFDSTSRSSSRTNNINNTLGASDQAEVQANRFTVDKKGSAAQANAAGSAAITGSGNTVTVTNTGTDYGALALAGDLLGATLESQSNLTAGALAANRELAETKVSDGANITSKTVRIALIAAAAVVAVVFLFKKT